MPTKSFKELFAKFLEEPTRDKFRELLREELGETDNLDFKKDWIDYPKLAKHILGLANSEGGVIIFGVDEAASPKAVGLVSIRDKVNVTNALKKYIPEMLRYDIYDYSYEASEYPQITGKSFQIIMVEDQPKYLPYVSMGESQDIDRDVIYVRRGTSSEKANYTELQRIFNRRIEIGYSTQDEFDLLKHLHELEALVDFCDRFYSPVMTLFMHSKIEAMGFYNFLKKLILEKKQLIEKRTLR